MKIFDFLTKTIGVDPGSQNLRITHNDELIFNETCELSVDTETNKVTGFGNESIHDQPNVIIKPVHTTISDFHAFEHLLRGAVKKSLNERNWLSNPYRVYFSLPVSATEVDKRAFRDSAEHAGAKEVYMIHQPCNSAIGMGILFRKKDFVLVDFGAGKVETTVFANSIPIAEGAVRIGTWKLEQALRNYLFRSYKLNLSFKESQHILTDLTILNNGPDINKTVIHRDDLKEALNPFLAVIEDQILETLEKAGNHPRIDKVFMNGCYFTGGGSGIDWITERLSLNGKINIHKSPDPFLDNINGLKEIIKAPEKFKDYLMV